MRQMLGRGVGPLIAVAVAMSWGLAHAQTCPSTVGGAPGAAQLDAAARYRFIDETLDREAHKGRIWNHAWGWGLLGTAVGQVTVGLLIPDDQCPDCWYVGAGKSMLGVASTAVLNPVRVRSIPALDGPPTCDQLAGAEAALVAAARSEKVKWMRHAEGLAVNVAATLYIGLELDEWGKAALSFAVGFAVGEYRLYSRPEGAIHALEHYRAGDLEARGDGGMPWIVVPTFGRDAAGLSFAIAF